VRVGFIQVYNEVNWIGFAIDQAMKMCDKVIVTEGYQHKASPGISIRSDDGTLDILSSKARQYAERLELLDTIRKHGVIRKNQCANFNCVLDRCALGDYFLILDADEFFTDEWIDAANDLMKEGKADLITTTDAHTFGISFKWCIIFGTDAEKKAEIIVKKIEGFKFRPSHKISGAGRNKINISGGRFHYMWVKSAKRMQLKMRVGMYKGMAEWLKEDWLTLKPEDGKEYECYNGQPFVLRRYNGAHPSILDDHPWRNVEDIRRLEG